MKTSKPKGRFVRDVQPRGFRKRMKERAKRSAAAKAGAAAAKARGVKLGRPPMKSARGAWVCRIHQKTPLGYATYNVELKRKTAEECAVFLWRTVRGLTWVRIGGTTYGRRVLRKAA